jgi:hypothetical protein
MNSRELLDVFYEGVAMFLTARKAGQYEDGGAGVSPEPRQRFRGLGHQVTISISDVSVKELEHVDRSRKIELERGNCNVAFARDFASRASKVPREYLK